MAESKEAFGRPEAEQYGFTPETWQAFISCPAVELADDIYNQAFDLAAKVGQWMELYGESPDAGLEAIREAGLAVPPHVAQWGTDLKYLPFHYRGMAVLLEWFCDMTRDVTPEPPEAAEGGVDGLTPDHTVAG